jgi:hypothetical protein
MSDIMERDEIIVMPFGEYKGVPIDTVMRTNQRYCRVLLRKQWFRDQYPKHYKMLALVFGEAEQFDDPATASPVRLKKPLDESLYQSIRRDLEEMPFLQRRLDAAQYALSYPLTDGEVASKINRFDLLRRRNEREEAFHLAEEMEARGVKLEYDLNDAGVETKWSRIEYSL